MKLGKFFALISLLLGIASPLPIWPGPALIRHLPPAIISFILITIACLLSKDSKTVGIIAMIYGTLATLAGSIFITLYLSATSLEFLTTTGRIVLIGGIIALVAGLVTLILGYKTFKRH